MSVCPSIDLEWPVQAVLPCVHSGRCIQGGSSRPYSQGASVHRRVRVNAGPGGVEVRGEARDLARLETRPEVKVQRATADAKRSGGGGGGGPGRGDSRDPPPRGGAWQERRARPQRGPQDNRSGIPDMYIHIYIYI